ncbi:MAG: hypothetical protein ABFS46_17155 [Myxococcota bacterium]
MRRAFRGAVLGITAVGLLSCASDHRWLKFDAAQLTPGVSSRAELYGRFGPPLFAYDRPFGETLIYSRVEGQGVTTGLRITAARLQLGSNTRVTDSLFVDVSDEDVVLRVRRYGGPPDPGWPWWPFGEESAD